MVYIKKDLKVCHPLTEKGKVEYEKVLAYYREHKIKDMLRKIGV